MVKYKFERSDRPSKFSKTYSTAQAVRKAVIDALMDDVKKAGGWRAIYSGIPSYTIYANGSEYARMHAWSEYNPSRGHGIVLKTRIDRYNWRYYDVDPITNTLIRQRK